MDGCTGVDGWYVDDVTVFLCFTESTPPTIEVVAGGTANSTTTGTMNLGLATRRLQRRSWSWRARRATRISSRQAVSPSGEPEPTER